MTPGSDVGGSGLTVNGHLDGFVPFVTNSANAKPGTATSIGGETVCLTWIGRNATFIHMITDDPKLVWLVRVPRYLRKDTKKLAKIKGVLVNELIERALNVYIEKHISTGSL